MKPIEFKDGGIVVNRFENQGGDSITITIKKRYPDSKQASGFNTTQNFKTWDIPKIVKVLTDYLREYPVESQS